MKSSKNTPSKVSDDRARYQRSQPDVMDAIAYGVRARLDASIQFSQRVTEEAIKTARAIGVSNKVIEKWASIRHNQETLEIERLRRLITLMGN